MDLAVHCLRKAVKLYHPFTLRNFEVWQIFGHFSWIAFGINGVNMINMIIQLHWMDSSHDFAWAKSQPMVRTGGTCTPKQGMHPAEALHVYSEKWGVIVQTGQRSKSHHQKVMIWVVTPQPSGLEGYCHHGPGGRAGWRLPDLRNPYLCNRLTDFLHSKFCGIV